MIACLELPPQKSSIIIRKITDVLLEWRDNQGYLGKQISKNCNSRKIVNILSPLWVLPTIFVIWLQNKIIQKFCRVIRDVYLVVKPWKNTGRILKCLFLKVQLKSYIILCFQFYLKQSVLEIFVLNLFLPNIQIFMADTLKPMAENIKEIRQDKL